MRRATSQMMRQSGLASPGAGRNGLCRDMRRSELVTVPSFSPQAAAGKQYIGIPGRVGAGDIGDGDEIAGPQRRADAGGVRHADCRIGAHDPERLDAAVANGLEQVDGLQAAAPGDVRRLPEARDAIHIGRVLERHVRRKLVRKSADLAAAHRVRLAGDRERSHARLADTAGRQMAVDDGVDLVGPVRRLVDALAVDRNGSSRRCEEFVEEAHVRSCEAATLRHAFDSGGIGGCQRHGLLEARSAFRDEAAIDVAGPGKVRQQPVEQQHVGARVERQMQVAFIGGCGAARIDHDDLGAALFSRGEQALIEDRVAPGGVGAGQHDEVGLLEILVGARHDVFAEGAAMACHRRSHAQPRIGVDVGRTDETLHQLVGDVIVFGEQLPGDVEGDRVRTVLCDGPGESGGDEVERLVPFSALPPISG